MLVSVVAVATIAYVLLTAWLATRARRGGPWRVDTVVDPEGSLRVVIVRDGESHGRTVRALPGDMDSVELAAELRLAREDAELQADELNR